MRSIRPALLDACGEFVVRLRKHVHLDVGDVRQQLLGARGLLYVELSVGTLPFDAHSGGANLLPNAAWRLVWALTL